MGDYHGHYFRFLVALEKLANGIRWRANGRRAIRHRAPWRFAEHAHDDDLSHRRRMLRMKPWLILVAAIVAGLMFRNWSKSSASQGVAFTGLTPQRGVYGTDATPVAGAT